MKYYSETLDKVFDTKEELEKAEAELHELELKEAAEKAKRKEDANKVEDAFKALSEAKKHYNEQLVALRKAYHEELVKARDNFDTAMKSEKEILSDFEKRYQDELSAFIKKYRSYHLTLTSPTETIELSSEDDSDNRVLNSVFSPMNFLSDLMDMWRF